MKVKIDLPQINQKNSSHGSKGLELNNVKQSRKRLLYRTSRTRGQDGKLDHSNKHLDSSHIKRNAKGRWKNGLRILRNEQHLNFSANANVRLNASSKGFSIGLNQNIRTVIALLFHASTPEIQNALSDFTGQQLISSLLLSGGITAEFQSKIGGHSKTLDMLTDKLAFKQLIIILSQTIPSNTPILDVQNLWEGCGGIFGDSGCSQTGRDLEIVAFKYAEALRSSELRTLVKLTEVLQKGQENNSRIDTKLYELLERIIARAEKMVVKQSQNSHLSFVRNEQTSRTTSFAAKTNFEKDIKDTQKQLNKPKISNAQSISEKDQIFAFTRDTATQGEFYSEKTELALRKQLEYYPHYAYEQQNSIFENRSDAQLGKQLFLNNYYDEIESWLESGKHRFVKDFEFDKPLGMIVDRGQSGFITADTIRVVLVRDGSVDGWHFLRSFVVS